VHGSAPKLAGEHKANPSAMFLTAGLMLDHLDGNGYFNKIKVAIRSVLKEARYLTYDLGGRASTNDMAKAILDKINAPKTSKSIALLATGSELVNGEYVDTNSQYFAKQLVQSGIPISSQQIINDDKKKIEMALKFHLNDNDCILLCGGLGPTSDDHTRFALAHAIDKELIFDQITWSNICKRLNSFGIKIHDDNRKQALFPKNAQIIPNSNGTAPGCIITIQDKLIFMLPGPPNECRPMFDNYVLPYLNSQGYATDQKTLSIKLIGVIEADIASDIDQLAKEYELQTAYCWNYPYLDIKIRYEDKNLSLILAFEKIINHKFQPFIVSKNGIDAIILLRDFLSKNPINLNISDSLSNGNFKSLFQEHKNLHIEKNNGFFITSFDTANTLDESVVYVVARGEEQFKRGEPYTGTIQFNCSILQKDKRIDKTLSIPYRGKEVIDYALHFMCFSIYTGLKELEL
ncbi:MAG: hypothetical protein K2Q14_00320, partial [Gammaproteobacteria bacterium]|nr:hypothetical protein [Gammaproteobacteria bacterium]